MPRLVVDDVETTEAAVFTFEATVTDAGESDTHVYSIDWESDGTFDVVDQPLPISANHTFAQDGVYTATVTVTDAADPESTVTQTVDVHVANVAPTVEDENLPGTLVSTPLPPREITIQSLLENALDVPSDQSSLEFVRFDPVSKFGATITREGDSLFYDGRTSEELIGLRTYMLGQLFVNETRDDEFRYVVRDSAGAESTGLITLTVLGVADPVFVGDDVLSVLEDAAGPFTGVDLRINDVTVDEASSPALLGARRQGDSDFTSESTISGRYGTLQWDVDSGIYSYEIDNTLEEVDRLGANDSLIEVFEFSVTQSYELPGGNVVEASAFAFGSSTSQLTITIQGSNDAPTPAEDSIGTVASMSRSVSTNGYGQIILADAPDAYWRFDEIDGTVSANALSPSTPDAVYESASQLGRPSLVPTDTGFAAVISPTQQITIPSHPDINTPASPIEEKTFEFVFQASAVDSLSTLYRQRNVDHGFVLEIENGELVFRARNNAVDSPNVSAPIDDNVTYHVVASFDSGAMSLSLNGVQVATDIAPFTAVEAHPATVRLGPSAGAEITIDELAIYNSVLTPEQVSAHHQAMGLLANDTDVDLGDTRRVVSVRAAGVTVPVGGQLTTAKGALVTVNADGSYEYDPNGAFESLAASEFDTDSFEYTLIDARGLTSSSTVTVTITGENEAPSDVRLSNAQILDDVAVGTLVGTFLTSDVDTTDTHTLALIDNAGGLFSLDGEDLRVAGDLQGTTSHDIVIRSTDSSGASVQRTLTINVVDADAIADRVVDLNDALLSSFAHVTIARNGDFVDVVGRASAGGASTPIFSQQIDQTNSITVLGQDGTDETVLVHLDNGFLAIPEGIRFEAGNSTGDALTVRGDTTRTDGEYVSENQGLGNASVLVNDGADQSFVRFDGVDSLKLLDFQQLSFTDTLQVGDRSLEVSSPNPIDLPELTEIGGGTLESDGVLTLGNADVLTGFGTVDGAFQGQVGSRVAATGDLVIGDSASTIGFQSAGEVHVGNHMLTLLDARQAVLGSLTSLGDASGPGTLITPGGLLLPGGNNIIGYGAVDAPNDIALLSMINGAVTGDSAAEPITLDGYIKGIGALDNVEFGADSFYSPGFSPAVTVSGSVAYGIDSTVEIEIGGLSAGASSENDLGGFDQLRHTGTAGLQGDLVVTLINGFEPNEGDSFTVITADDGVSGMFETATLPQLSGGLSWEINYGATEVELAVVRRPIVEAVRVNSGDASRSQLASLEVSFSTEVDPTGLLNAFAITNLTSGLDVGMIQVATAVQDGKTIATLTFDGQSTETSGSLADGNYRLIVRASDVVAVSGGSAMASDFVFGRPVAGGPDTDDFFRLFGDTDGDRDVDGQDYGRFGLTFFQSAGDPNFNADLDFDGDGDVDGQDYGQFGLRFLTNLPN
ncbi:MAG: VCBS domain-containing protein [Planctomycetota bacterium]